MEELLHATDRNGRYVKTANRSELLAEIRDYSRAHGDAPLAVPVVHIMLTGSDGRVRLVQRGAKPENPLMWDKTVGGHVVTESWPIDRNAFHENARKELQEEVGIHQIVLAEDPVQYRLLSREGSVDFREKALLRMVDYEPWQGSVSRVKNGESWLKRHNVASYVGIFDGPFQFLDGEALATRAMEKGELMIALKEKPWCYADGLRVFMDRYYYFL
ncbi:MAG: NUDIX domain-containing protein [Magnetococcales bacterium]|nr:NUDIX domain-containing protein [Magnetococcales bacterium]